MLELSQVIVKKAEELAFNTDLSHTFSATGGDEEDCSCSCGCVETQNEASEPCYEAVKKLLCEMASFTILTLKR